MFNEINNRILTENTLIRCGLTLQMLILDAHNSKKIFLNISKSPQGGLVLIFPLKREDKYIASLGVDNKLIFFHIWETKVDYFVEREINGIVQQF